MLFLDSPSKFIIFLSNTVKKHTNNIMRILLQTSPSLHSTDISKVFTSEFTS